MITRIEWILNRDYPVLFVAFESAVKVFQWDVIILIEPLHNERFKPPKNIESINQSINQRRRRWNSRVMFKWWWWQSGRREGGKERSTWLNEKRDVKLSCQRWWPGDLRGIFWHGSFILWQILDVVIVQPLDFKMKVHVGGWLAESLLFVFFKGVLHIHCKECPHCVGRQLWQCS